VPDLGEIGKGWLDPGFGVCGSCDGRRMVASCVEFGVGGSCDGGSDVASGGEDGAGQLVTPLVFSTGCDHCHGVSS